jgi:transcription elongation factor GreA
MSDQSYPMTAEALENLKAELKYKIEVARPALAARLKSAIEMGDLSENADYHAAKEEQGFLEGRIQQLQVMIRYAVIIKQQVNSDTVQLGSRVKVLESGEEEPVIYQIVGAVEARPREGRISQDSPLGMALLGTRVGATVRVKAPAGELVFKILEIS